jgi:hypothetical protein
MLLSLVPGRAQVNEQAPGTTSQDSRGPRVPRPGISGLDALGLLLAAAAFVGAVLLVISDFTTLFRVHTEAGVTVPSGTVKGHDNHSYSMLIIGLASLPLAYAATRYGSRPAMTGLAGLGLIAVVIAIGFDLSDATGTNTLARTFENATGSPAAGFYLETLGAALLIVSGGGGLVLTGPERGPGPGPEPPEETSPETSGADRREEERAAAAAARAQARARRGSR